MPKEVKEHIPIAFWVDNFENLLTENKLLKLWTTDKGKKVTFILHYGTVIELVEK